MAGSVRLPIMERAHKQLIARLLITCDGHKIEPESESLRQSLFYLA